MSNPIAVADLGPKPDSATGEFTFVGRLSPEKGVLVFAEAARRLGIRPVFVGDGPMRGELASRYPEAELRGWQGQEGVAAAMRAARALVFSSLWYEGQPLPVLEAKARGTPVIAAMAGIVEKLFDSVEHGVTGLWFKRGDAGDLAAAMAQLRHDGTVARMSHASSQAFWRDPPTIERHVAEIEKVYRIALGAPDAMAGTGAIRAA